MPIGPDSKLWTESDRSSPCEPTSTPTAAYLSAASAGLPDGHEWVGKVKTAQHEVLAGVRRSGQAGRDHVSASGTTRRLEELKNGLCAELPDPAHKIPAGSRRRKGQERACARLAIEVASAAVPLSSSCLAGTSTDYQERLTGLKSCVALTEQDLRATPVCPHCGFKPGPVPAAAPAEMVLNDLKEELNTLTVNWTRTLLTNLDDPNTRKSVELLSPKSQALVKRIHPATRAAERARSESDRGPEGGSLGA